VIADREFECVLFADSELVDKKAILASPLSPLLGNTTDGKNVLALLDRVLKPGKGYRKKEHGPALASKMRLLDVSVTRRSRSLQKLVKELTPALARQP
jgi:hypothetical protein